MSTNNLQAYLGSICPDVFGAFEKNIGENMNVKLRHSLCLSVCPNVQLQNRLTEFYKIYYWGVLLKFVSTLQFPLIS
jgi:hypothetical protein